MGLAIRNMMKCAFVVVVFGVFAVLSVRGDGGGIDGNLRKFRGVVEDFLPCAISFDVGCAVDRAEGILRDTTKSLMVEADAEVKSTGRADEDNNPSVLVQALTKLMSEFADVFKSGLSSFFRNGKEGEDTEEEVDEEEASQEEASQNSRSGGNQVEEARGKKKKKKLVGLIKLLLLGAVIKAKLALLLKVLAVKLQIKFFLVALAGLILNAARFYLDLKRGHQPQKVIYYEHAQHQHHYEGGDEEWAGPSSSGGSYWGRSYDEKDGKDTSAQNMAYAKQKPLAVSVVNNKPNYSWL